MKDPKVKIFVAAHKPAELLGDECYQFIQVGASLHPNIAINNAVKDNDNIDNISNRNDIYCELTGLYHIWKNIHNVDYVGLVHYRRYLAHKKVALNPHKVILSEQEIVEYMQLYDVIVSNKSKKQGERSGYFRIKEDIPEFCFYRFVKPAIIQLYPEYLEEFEKEFYINRLCAGNIMICSKQLFDDYCEWLFNILFLVEKQLDESSFGIAPRELGYFSEYLMNVWIRKNKLNVLYKPVLFIEDRSKWTRKLRLYMNLCGLEKFSSLLDNIYSKVKTK